MASAAQPGLGVPPPPAYVNRNLLAQPLVPAMPANIALAIDADKSLLVTFDAPPSDFGSQVSSYKVEWDSNPGAREEQVVTCTVATGPNEVQKLTTSASRVPEVQVVSITATSAAGTDQLGASRRVRKKAATTGSTSSGLFAACSARAVTKCTSTSASLAAATATGRRDTRVPSGFPPPPATRQSADHCNRTTHPPTRTSTPSPALALHPSLPRPTC